MTPPLAGRTVLVTRPQQQAAALSQAIRAAGGDVFDFPALVIEAVPLEELSAALEQFGAAPEQFGAAPEKFGAAHAQLEAADIVIFISPNAAQFGMAAIQAVGRLPASSKIFAVGPGTTRVLQDLGVLQVLTPQGQDSEALLALPQLQHVAGKRVVIVRGVGGRAVLSDTLTSRGADVHFLECYRRCCPQADVAPLLSRLQTGGIDAVTITSAEALHNLAGLLGEAGAPLLANTPLFAPHEKIAEAARRFGIAQVIATPGGDAGLVDGLINWFGNTR